MVLVSGHRPGPVHLCLHCRCCIYTDLLQNEYVAAYSGQRVKSLRLRFSDWICSITVTSEVDSVLPYDVKFIKFTNGVHLVAARIFQYVGCRKMSFSAWKHLEHCCSFCLDVLVPHTLCLAALGTLFSKTLMLFIALFNKLVLLENIPSYKLSTERLNLSQFFHTWGFSVVLKDLVKWYTCGNHKVTFLTYIIMAIVTYVMNFKAFFLFMLYSALLFRILDL